MITSDFYGFNKINYWRNTNQTEIDFIVQKETGTEAIEVKWNSRRFQKSFQTIKLFVTTQQV